MGRTEFHPTFKKVGRHAAAVDFLRASGFLDADDASGQPKWVADLPWTQWPRKILLAKKMAMVFLMVEVANF